MAFSGFAQDDEESNTIADIVVASASAEEGAEFTVLLTAVQAADPIVLELLADPEAEVTVFAPTDAAFTALFGALGEETVTALLEDPAALTEILTYHVVEGAAFSEDVAALLVDGDFSVETLNGQYVDVATTEEGGITLDDANLVLEMLDIEADNGVIHVIDAVLLPEDRTIAEVVVEAASAEEGAEFTSLLAAVQAADPAVLEALSNPDAELTVFAPTDEAFAALGEETISAVLADQALVTGILLYHAAEGATYSGDIVDYFMGGMDMEEEGDMEEGDEAEDMDEEGMDDMMSDALVVTMLDGLDAEITVTEEGVFINDAQIILTDIDAANGVIHVIDAVLMPPMDDMGDEE